MEDEEEKMRRILGDEEDSLIGQTYFEEKQNKDILSVQNETSTSTDSSSGDDYGSEKNAHKNLGDDHGFGESEQKYLGIEKGFGEYENRWLNKRGCWIGPQHLTFVTKFQRNHPEKEIPKHLIQKQDSETLVYLSDFHPFSIFYKSEFTVDGLTYAHAMQYIIHRKASLFNVINIEGSELCHTWAGPQTASPALSPDLKLKRAHTVKERTDKKQVKSKRFSFERLKRSLRRKSSVFNNKPKDQPQIIISPAEDGEASADCIFSHENPTVNSGNTGRSRMASDGCEEEYLRQAVTDNLDNSDVLISRRTSKEVVTTEVVLAPESDDVLVVAKKTIRKDERTELRSSKEELTDADDLGADLVVVRKKTISKDERTELRRSKEELTDADDLAGEVLVVRKKSSVEVVTEEICLLENQMISEHCPGMATPEHPEDQACADTPTFVSESPSESSPVTVIVPDDIEQRHVEPNLCSDDNVNAVDLKMSPQPETTSRDSCKFCAHLQELEVSGDLLNKSVPEYRKTARRRKKGLHSLLLGIYAPVIRSFEHEDLPRCTCRTELSEGIKTIWHTCK